MTESTPKLSADLVAQLNEHGVPAETHKFFPKGLGELIPRMGIIFSELTAERAVASMPVQGNTQPVGLLHGGASAVLAETLGSLAAGIHGGVDSIAVGVDLNATHVRPSISGHVTGICTAVKLGRTVCVHTIEIMDESDRTICTARITNMIIPRP